jgi:hypothetical protein
VLKKAIDWLDKPSRAGHPVTGSCRLLPSSHAVSHVVTQSWPLSARTMKGKNMAVKVETLRITARHNTSKPAVVARFATAVRSWARRGQLGPSSTSEMRGYTGAR